MIKFLEEAQNLYGAGKWSEAANLIGENKINLIDKEEKAEAYRLLGWCFYYMGTKGPEKEKMEMLQRSRDMFDLASKETLDTKRKISVFNGWPLSAWILGQEKEAWQISDQAIKEFPDEPSVWNTRSILCRWAKDLEKSVEVCKKVYETALAKEDYRTAGHGKNNMANALKELGRVAEARQEWQKAIELYKKFEETTGQSAKFHIEGVKKKLF